MPRMSLPRVRPGAHPFEGEEPRCDAFLEESDPSWTVYAGGYRLSAETLVERAVHDRQMRDCLIYPIIFIYRQYLELSLKEIILLADELSEIDQGVPFGHDLRYLLERCKKGLDRVGDGSFEQEIKVIENAVIHFNRIDPGSIAFRYPQTREGGPVLHHRSRVSLTALRRELSNAGLALRMIAYGLSAVLDQRKAFAHEWWP